MLSCPIVHSCYSSIACPALLPNFLFCWPTAAPDPPPDAWLRASTDLSTGSSFSALSSNSICWFSKWPVDNFPEPPTYHNFSILCKVYFSIIKPLPHNIHNESSPHLNFNWYRWIRNMCNFLEVSVKGRHFPFFFHSFFLLPEIKR